MTETLIKQRPICSPWVNDLSLPPILKNVYARRVLQGPENLDNSIQQLVDYKQLSNIDEAVELLYQSMLVDRHILIVGDFDADGATSIAVVMRALALFNYQHVSYLVPNRFDFGYGLSPELVDVALTMPGISKDTLIVTVDNGIACHSGVAAARAAGFKVLVTDHHLPAAELPDADVIVNPNLHGDNFKSKSIAGVGVAFYLMLALRAHLRDKNWFNEAVPNLATLLDLVALGTVADVVSLDHTNRILVEQGLQRIRQGRCVPGIQALIKVAGRQYKKLVATDLGFALAPRLNAAGRLEDISVGIECLLTDNIDNAMQLAQILDTINQERRDIQQQMSDEAMQIVQQLEGQLQQQALPPALVLYQPDWHQGVVGIVASKVKAEVNRPVIVFAKVSEQELKGSARSIDGVNIRDVLEQLDKMYPHIMRKYGGHAMAAGLSIDIAQYDAFQQALTQAMQQLGVDQIRANEIYTDGHLASTDLTLQNAMHLRLAGPWGQAFPEPLFEGVFVLQDWRVLKDAHLKMSLSQQAGTDTIEAIAFNQVPDWLKATESDDDIQLHIVYRLDVNDFRGINSVQLIVEYIRKL